LLRVGDVVEVLAGELVPVDGPVLVGESLVDEAILTGESQPVRKAVGDPVAAGTMNVHAALRIQATAVGRETRIGQIVQLVERSAAEKPAIVEWANRIGAWFVVVVMILAAITIAIWAGASWPRAIDQAVALLIVACPCALALATPLAISVALGRAADRQILIKGGDVLQRLQQPKRIWLDKTGTLTQGKMEVLSWYGDPQYRQYVAALERNSAHPVAVALSRLDQVDQAAFHPSVESQTRTTAAEASPGAVATTPVLSTPQTVTNVQQSALGGITGEVDGVAVAIGNAAFVMGAVDGAIPDALIEQAKAIVAAAQSPVYVAVAGKVVAIAGVGDALRPDAKESVQRLQALGWQVGILSGDHPQIVARVADQLGIPHELAHGGMMPEDKIAILRKFPESVMVGDGVNDSAALAFASVGIAVHGGSETSLQAAPVYLARAGLAPVLELLAGSRNTLATIRYNFAASLAYNAIAVVLAMTGLINPLLAAALMPLSSITVVLLSIAPGNFRVTAQPAHFPSPNEILPL
jgi:Cu2+-exporting ATPase